MRFRHLLEKHKLAPKVLALIGAGLARPRLMLKACTVVAASIIAAPSSTKNSTGKRDPRMHQTRKGNQRHFGMKAQGKDTTSTYRASVHQDPGKAQCVHDCVHTIVAYQRLTTDR